MFAITTDASARLAEAEGRGVPCHTLPKSGRPGCDLAPTPIVNLLEQEGLNVGYLAFNTEKEPFTDKRVRKALNLAINKQAIMDAVFQGSGTAPKNPIPPYHLVVRRRGRRTTPTIPTPPRSCSRKKKKKKNSFFAASGS